MAKIPKKSHRQVTFSKRRLGLFKKASELCTLCGVEVVIVVFSPAKKVFSFGHPEVEAIIDRFLSQNPPLDSKANKIVEACRNANVRELNVHLTEILDQLEVEKKRGEELSQMRKESQQKHWWESPIEELALNELEQLRVSLEDLRNNVGQQAKKVLMESTSSQFTAANGMPQFDTKFGDAGVNPMIPHVHNFGYGYGMH